MLRDMNDLKSLAIGATDGAIGHVQDFYFDDEAWVIRYLAVDTGEWLFSRQVLISPMALGRPDWKEKKLPVSVTREQVRNSPDIDTKKPVSRQHEMRHLAYYGYPYYWGGGSLWGAGLYPDLMLTNMGSGRLDIANAVSRVEPAADVARSESGDVHLRSYKAVMGYHIHAMDGDIGHASSLLVDDETWAIRYLVVNTSNWWLGHEVLIPPQWIQQVSWHEEKISVDLARQAIQDAPPYTSATPPDRQQEMAIYVHYRRSGYWVSDAERGAC